MEVRLRVGEREATFSERVLVVAGRADDCGLRIADDQQVSRHHCLLDVNPPHLRLRDFGSLNGTYLNDVRIGRRDPGLSPEEGQAVGRFETHDVRDGDEIRMGRTRVRVALPPPPSTTPPPRTAAAGTPALGEYELVRELSRGGMGAVHLARARADGRVVAVKVLLPELAAETGATAGFLREIENTRALHDPHVVTFHDAGTAEGTLYLVLEFCSGGSVYDAWERAGGRLDVETVVRFGTQALAGLAYAHVASVPRVELADGNIVAGRGIVHRDIKPQNLLLDAEGTLKVSDFGLSKALDRAGLTRHTRTGMVAGTPVFMARKQLTDYRYAGPEVDVWSLAATLYWLLTGSPPRDFSAGADPMLTVLEHDAVPIRRRRADVPAALAEVLDQALTETPEIGFGSARELHEALVGAAP